MSTISTTKSRLAISNAFATPKLALSDGRADIDTTIFSDFLVKVYLFSKLWGVHLFVGLGLASDLIVHDIFTWGMSWTLHIELGFVHLNFPGLLINEMTCFHW